MKSVLENRPVLVREASQAAKVAGYLQQEGWTKRNRDNIALNIMEYINGEIRGLSAISEVEQIGKKLLFLKGYYFYYKEVQMRMRDLVCWSMENGSVICILDSCSSYVIIADRPVMPTSELFSHLAVHNYLIGKGSSYRASLRMHPIELVAMAHSKKFMEKDVATNLFRSMIPETKTFCPRDLEMIPYELPSSVESIDATIEALSGRDAAIRGKHEVFAMDIGIMSAFDQIDVLNRSALIYIASKNTGFEPGGMSREQMEGMARAFNLSR